MPKNWKRYLPWICTAAAALLLIGGFVIYYFASLPPVVGICMHNLSDVGGKAYAQQLQEQLTDAGYTCKIRDAHNDQTRQNDQVASLLNKNVAGLVVSPVMPSAAASVARQAAKDDVPLVFVSRMPEDKALSAGENICYVGSDLAQGAALQGSLVAQLPAKGDVNGDGVVSYVVLQGNLESIDTAICTDNAVAGMEKAGIKSKELEKVCGQGTFVGGEAACVKLLSVYGKDIEVILCNNDAMALGAVEAIADGGRTVGKDIYLLGIGGSQTALEQVSAGKISALVREDMDAQVKAAADTVKRLLNNESVKKETFIDYVAVNKKN